MTNHLKPKGFTLLEILIALSIFSIMAVVATAALYNIFHTQEAINKESAKLSEIQLAFIRLERDISQIINRPIDFANDHMEMTTVGQSNPLGIKQNSSLSRVKYAFSKNMLIRYAKPNAQLLEQNPTNHEVLLHGLKSLTFQYLDDKYQLQKTWYPRFLPVAIRVDIDSNYFGKISRFFALPQSMSVMVKHKKTKSKVPNER